MPPVVSVTSDQLNLWMVAFLWPFIRMLALISTAPIFSEHAVPRRTKVGLAMLLTLVIAGPWMLNTVLDYMRNLFSSIPQIVG